MCFLLSQNFAQTGASIMAKSKQQEMTEVREEVQVENPQAEAQEEDEPERLSRRECAQRVIAEVDGDCTLNELAEKADKLFVTGRDGDRDYSDPDSAGWHIQKILETLEGVGLVELSWECVIHPKVARLGLTAGK
jgi:hypothetical protein